MEKTWFTEQLDAAAREAETWPDWARKEAGLPHSERNAYIRMFSGVTKFRTLDEAESSLKRIDDLYHQFRDERDVRGQHQAQITALMCKNRAETLFLHEEAALFRRWLRHHLNIQR